MRGPIRGIERDVLRSGAVRAYDEGRSIRDVAAVIGVSYATAYKLLIEGGIVPQALRRGVPDGHYSTGDELWRSIPETENLYEVSNRGRVRNVRRLNRAGGVIVLSAHRDTGHQRAMFSVRGRVWQRFVHALVLEAFVGPRPFGQVCRHLDGNPANNFVANLAWGTASENMADRIKHGRHRQSNTTRCPKGHAYDEANTYWRRDGRVGRNCKACQRGSKQVRAQAAA